ncbi:hypothetical protein NL676_001345 [Syzygium grande]|nr:hypothetical protein NL676_001345 [Syzygium grande]
MLTHSSTSTLRKTPRSPKSTSKPGTSDRTLLLLAFFASPAYGHAGPVLLRHWKEKDGDVRVYEGIPKGISYRGTIRTSKYCICPEQPRGGEPKECRGIYAGVHPANDVQALRTSFQQRAGLGRVLGRGCSGQYTRFEEVMPVQMRFLGNVHRKTYDVSQVIVHSIWLRRLNLGIENR